MKQNYDACLKHVLASEGGYVDHPRDPGGATNMGITHLTLAAWRGHSVTKTDVKNLTLKEAAAIYRANYWNAVRGDDLPSGLDMVAFDGAVNSGVSRGAKWLQLAVNAQADGRIGPATLNMAQRANAVNAINAACMRRLAFLQSLSTWGTFGRGWQRRVDGVRVFALSLAEQPEPVLPTASTGGLAAIFAAIIKALTAFFGGKS